MSDELPELLVESATELRAWLHQHHASSKGAWLVTWKKASGRPRVAYEEIVPELLSFGWIDGKARAIDQDRSARLISPRSPKSNWSGLNKQHVAALVAAGKMTPAGEAAVRLAKNSGTWTALDRVEALEEPEELATALDRDPQARHHWDEFPPSAKRAILEWIGTAKRSETRSKRIKETAEKAAGNIRANQWRQPGSKG